MRSSPHKWTEAEVARMLALRDRGMSNMAIAEALGLTPKQIHNKFEQMSETRRWRRHGIYGALATRPCMCCRRPFPSEGKHNRMCKTCKEIHA